MESSRPDDAYVKPEYINGYEEHALIPQAIHELVEFCERYRVDKTTRFKNAQDLLAKHVIDQLNILNDRYNNITLEHRLPFKTVVLKSYIIALQEYLLKESIHWLNLRKKRSRLLDAIDTFVDKFFPNQNFDDVKQEYRKEIDQIKEYFSSFLFRNLSEYEYRIVSGISVFYSAYKKKHPDISTHRDNEVELNSIGEGEEKDKNLISVKQYK